ncbi:hypothetical protein V6N12_076438 [Hibiscus sabdariffa]|uniref:Uncharacterized protein n=1 Tax=Hibiscus sabdariffa TaxID=183260 RepID=A0ABR2DAP0_9ROSI
MLESWSSRVDWCVPFGEPRQSSRQGGLLLWWKNDVKFSILHSAKNIIDCELSINGEEDWFYGFIYGPPYEDENEAFWESLSTIRSNSQSKWCIVGDSNIVVKAEDKMGGVPFEPSQAKWFFDFLNKSCMMELLIQGGMFTCSNQRSDDDVMVEKLDRILSSLEWSEMFPKALGVLDVSMASDHAPIILFLQGISKRCKKDFKFESKWFIKEDCF